MAGDLLERLLCDGVDQVNLHEDGNYLVVFTAQDQILSVGTDVEAIQFVGDFNLPHRCCVVDIPVADRVVDSTGD